MNVLQGFAVIAVIVTVGVFLARSGVLGQTGQTGLSKLAFNVATPALLFTLMADAHLEVLYSSQFVVTAIAMTAVALIYSGVGALRRWGLGTTTSGAMAASYVNAGNLGIPIAVYVLGDATLVAPVMLGQQLIMGPVFMTLLDIASRDEDAPRLRWWQIVVRPFRNPIVIGALGGIAVSALGVTIPAFLLDPLELLGGMSVPAMLLAFGMSLWGNAIPFREPDRAPAIVATVLKVFVHPALAWVIGAWLFGLDGAALLIVVVTAALPSAQNVFTYASNYGVGMRVARETILATTFLSVPVIFVVSVLLSR